MDEIFEEDMYPERYEDDLLEWETNEVYHDLEHEFDHEVEGDCDDQFVEDDPEGSDYYDGESDFSE